MNYKQILEKLKSLEDPKAVAGMARFGINPERNYGLSVSTITKLSKEVGKDHDLAQALWTSGIRDARMLACLIDDPSLVTEAQMDTWALDFNSWDICDHCCGHLFDKTEFAYKKVKEWSSAEPEFVKRAGFALLAWLAVHDKKADDKVFINLLPIIKREAKDDRNYVKKAVNWALRHIGKRNMALNKIAIEAAVEIKKLDFRSARWIASDAIRELTSSKIQERLKKKKK